MNNINKSIGLAVLAFFLLIPFACNWINDKTRDEYNELIGNTTTVDMFTTSSTSTTIDAYASTTTTTTTITPSTTTIAPTTTSTSTTIAPLYEVTFNSDGGSFVNSQTINYGGKVTQPIDPTKTNYIFSGWYKESTLINLWNFDLDTITTNTILYAGWMFDSNPALWAKSVTAGTDTSEFNSVAVDSSGNVYAAGYQKGTGSYTYGEGVSVAGSYAGTDYYDGNVVLVKYNSSGAALWAKSVTAGTDTSEFNSVAVDSSGNIYAAGYQRGTGSYTYGEGVSVAGSYSGYNVVLVKYDSSGTALWAKSVTAGASWSLFYSVAVDSSGNVYAAGHQGGTGSFTYGEGVSVAGSYSGSNVVLVKYDSSGTALWAKSVTAGNDYSRFYSVAVDSSGNVYAAGYQDGRGSFTYGEGVSVAGTYWNNNVVLVKYNSSGNALWARSVTAGNDRSEFNSVAVDSSGNVYAAGYQDDTGSYTYGEGVSVAGTYWSNNVVLVKYNSSGTALWAKSVTAGTSYSRFYSVAVDSSGNVYAAGYQYGTGSLTYGEGVSVAGSYSDCNVVLVKYDSSGTALWAKSVTAGDDYSEFNSVAVDSSGNVYAAGYQRGMESYTYGPGVSVAGSYSGTNYYDVNVVLVKYGATP
ncbi:MAG TPA: InlB B-repeat-containing protein [Spirochaetota bacterium]|nr:MAG: Beta-propeller repeat protein [Spirochaetes bacterium ADurb.Bin133]HPY88735.1 InlB B-repeat-containing protein [Spirochaetota bacterium]